MKEFKVIPYEAIGPVRLGMTRDRVRQVLGRPSCVRDAQVKGEIHFPNKDYFFNNAFQISYDADLKAEFIEIAAESDYIVTFDGVRVHHAPHEQVLAAIRKHAQPDVTDSEYPINMFFPDLDLSLYREHSEEDNFDAIGISPRGYRKK